MANVDFTTNPYNACPNCVLSAGLPHASERANPDAQPNGAEAVDVAAATGSGEEDGGLISPLEEALEEERTRLMLADSVLGCLQIALDPEAIKITPEPCFPEVLQLARQFINKSVRQLEYEEIRRLLHTDR